MNSGKSEDIVYRQILEDVVEGAVVGEADRHRGSGSGSGNGDGCEARSIVIW